MKYLLSTTLVIVIVLGLSILEGNINAEPISNSTIKISKSESPIGVLPPVEYNGTNFLTYVKSGGFVPVNQIYTYNVFNKEISSVDVNNNTIAKKNLNETQLKSLNDVVLKQFSSADENGILDDGSCADCTKHGLDYVYVILNATTGRQIYLPMEHYGLIQHLKKM
jgi:hypothetical protein